MNNITLLFRVFLLLIVFLCACVATTNNKINDQIEHAEACLSQAPTVVRYSIIDPSIPLVPFPERESKQFIMVHEVGVREFARYVLASFGESAASKWIEDHRIGFDMDLPLAGPTENEILAYCLWIGGRLPTVLELTKLIRKQYPEYDALVRGKQAADLRFNYNGRLDHDLHRAPLTTDEKTRDAKQDGWLQRAPKGVFRKGTSDSAPQNLLGNIAEVVPTEGSIYTDGNGSSKGEFSIFGGSWAQPIICMGRYGLLWFTSNGEYDVGFRVVLEEHRVR